MRFRVSLHARRVYKRAACVAAALLQQLTLVAEAERIGLDERGKNARIMWRACSSIKEAFVARCF